MDNPQSDGLNKDLQTKNEPLVEEIRPAEIQAAEIPLNENQEEVKSPSDQAEAKNILDASPSDRFESEPKDDGRQELDKQTKEFTGEKIPISELLYGVIFQPNKTFPLFRYYQPWGWALAFLFVVNLITSLLTFLNLNSNDILGPFSSKLAGSFSLGPLSAGLGIYAGIFFYPLTIMFFTLHVSLLHFLAELLGGKGQVLGLFSALAFVQILGIFSAVLKIFSDLANSQVLLFIPLGLAIGIWQLVLSVIAIREIYLISTGRALLILLLPVIIVIAVVFYMIFTGIAFLGPLFSTFKTYL